MSKGLGQSSDLHSLAGSLRQSAEGLGNLFVAVSTLFERQSAQFSATERNLATDILKRISKDVEMSLRIALAEKLADRPDAPSELINLLVDDRIEVARPILLRSPVLTEADLLRIVVQADADHQVAVAERPLIGEAVTAALARSDCEAVLIALIRNEGAKISEETFQSLATRARANEGLQGPLIGRKDLPAQLAVRMYVWVSAALKESLSARYPQIAHSLAHALDDAATNLKNGKPTGNAESAKRLVDKLNAAGQLKASFLVRVLQQGQMDLFEQAFAAMLKMEPEAIRTMLYGKGASTVALACRAVGIDRSVFQTVFHLSRHHREVPATITEAEHRSIEEIFTQLPKTEAFDRVRSLAA